MDWLIRLVLSVYIVMAGFVYFAPPSAYQECVAAGHQNCWLTHRVGR
jgi:hypothetical protein